MILRPVELYDFFMITTTHTLKRQEVDIEDVNFLLAGSIKPSNF